jgi:uncharacterized membrane protein
LRARLKRFVLRLGHALWFEPVLMLAGAVALGVLLPALDRSLPRTFEAPTGWGRWLGGSASGVRDTLGASATALATILAISVTATMVVIQLAAGMYTSRLLRRFLADRPIRQVLGTFTGSVVYLILVLGEVRSPVEGGEFVPVLSVVVGRLLMIVCLVVLILFVHYTARSVQVATIVRRVTQDALSSMTRLQDGSADRGWGAPAFPPVEAAGVVRSQAAGYVQVLELQEVISGAPGEATLLRVDAGPGDFVFPGAPLVSAWSREGAPPPCWPDRAARQVRGAFATGRERTVEQDPGFAVRQLADVALKALSPGINDATTAEMVVNELGTLAAYTAAAGELGGWQAIRPNRPTVWTRRFGLAQVLDAVAEVAEAAAAQPRVLARILDVLLVARSGESARPLAREALARAAAQVFEAADPDALSPRAKQMLGDRRAALG